MSETGLEKRVRDLEVTVSAIAAEANAHRDLTMEQFKAAKEAITKAEAAQAEYNKLHNDLVRKNELMAKREDVEQDFDQIRGDIRELRDFKSNVGGKSTGHGDMLGWLIAGLVLLFTILEKMR